MIEQLRKSTKKKLKYVKLPPPRQHDAEYILQNKNDLIIKALLNQTDSLSNEESNIARVRAHHVGNAAPQKMASILKKKL